MPLHPSGVAALRHAWMIICSTVLLPRMSSGHVERHVRTRAGRRRGDHVHGWIGEWSRRSRRPARAMAGAVGRSRCPGVADGRYRTARTHVAPMKPQASNASAGNAGSRPGAGYAVGTGSIPALWRICQTVEGRPGGRGRAVRRARVGRPWPSCSGPNGAPGRGWTRRCGAGRAFGPGDGRVAAGEEVAVPA